jgi:hypothetical protein
VDIQSTERTGAHFIPGTGRFCLPLGHGFSLLANGSPVEPGFEPFTRHDDSPANTVDARNFPILGHRPQVVFADAAPSGSLFQIPRATIGA